MDTHWNKLIAKLKEAEKEELAKIHAARILKNLETRPLNWIDLLTKQPNG